MSGGAWQELYVDIDEATYLTGQDALDWLTSRGDAEFYRAEYWYADIGGAAIRSLRIAPAGSAAPVKVVTYTWPTVPAPGFYGPSMTKQNVEFGVFYDAIVMLDDSAGLLNRYYWFTVTGEYLTRIEEQPRDPFYEP